MTATSNCRLTKKPHLLKIYKISVNKNVHITNSQLIIYTELGKQERERHLARIHHTNKSSDHQLLPTTAVVTAVGYTVEKKVQQPYLDITCGILQVTPGKVG